MTRTPQQEYNRYQAGNRLFGRNETATKVLREIWERDNPTPRETVVRLEVTVNYVHHVVHHVANPPDGDVTAPAPRPWNLLLGSARRAISAEPWDASS